MKSAKSAPPSSITVPIRTEQPGAGTPAQQAFQEVILSIESLREQLRAQKVAQAESRRRYWQQVGPVAAGVVSARRSLFPTLEEALLRGYFSRLEESQITNFILGNARALEDRFGEDEAAIIHKYAAAGQGSGSAAKPTPAPRPEPEFIPDPSLPPHEQAAARARARRKTKAQRSQEAADQARQTEQQQLESNTKTIYRQLARTHHPDLERDPAKQAGKTTQMQRITEAYEADDLFTLLQLLAESDPTDAESDDVLTRYTRALLQQQIALQQELNQAQFGTNGPGNSSGKKQELELRQLKRNLRAEAEYLQHVARAVQEPAGLRELLRELANEGLDSV